jgi:hypothetical protein
MERRTRYFLITKHALAKPAQFKTTRASKPSKPACYNHFPTN